MPQTERERSREQGDANEGWSEEETERVQQFGAAFYITVAISALFVLAGVFFTEPFGSALATVVGYITDYLGWLYMLMTSFFLGFAVWLALSRYGKIRLGKPDEKPEFGRFAWFAMLFQAGMGIGLVFWAVSEPVTHYTDPPLGLARPETRPRTPPRWPCKPRSSTGGCILGQSTPSSASPSRTSATAGA
jgi:choline-glycine betaine transporter